jgi:hypothetical protein
MWMGGMWSTWTSLLIMFGKFEKTFGQFDNKEKKLLGECISYILPLVNASSFASYLLSYWARLFRTSPNCWRHRASDVSSYLRSIRIIPGRRKMGHVHAGNMYRSTHKEAKEFLCDSLTILLSFESKSVMGKILRQYVARYVTSTHHEWRHRWRWLQWHPIIPRGQIKVDEQRLARLFENAARFVALKNAACQSSIGYGTWLR